MKNILYTFLLVGTSLLLGSCSKDEDTSPPTIEIQKPQENEVVFTGSTLKMRFRFTDEYGIQKYSYEIFPEVGDNTYNDFVYSNEVFIPTLYTELVFDHSVLIPEMSTYPNVWAFTTTGNYILRVTATDNYGNVNTKERIFKVEALTPQE
jgi:hypothetical protein